MDEYTNNLHARIDNILSDVQGTNQLNKNLNNSVPGRQYHFSEGQQDYSIEIGVCWLIVGVLIGCAICYYSFFYDRGNRGDDDDNDDGDGDDSDDSDDRNHRNHRNHRNDEDNDENNNKKMRKIGNKLYYK